MADAELTKALKDLQYRIQTASLKERKEVIENVINVLSNPGINENIVKGICKVLVLTIPRYKDSYSQQIIRNLIIALLEKHSEVSVKCLISVLLDVATQQKNIVATRGTSQSALFALNWSTLIFMNGWKRGQSAVVSEISRLVELQAYLLTAILATGNNKRAAKSLGLLSRSWSSVPDSEKLYLETIKTSEQNQEIVVLASALSQRLAQHNSDVLTAYLKFFEQV